MIRRALPLGLILAVTGPYAGAVTIPMALIGNPGNPADVRPFVGGFGSVGYKYRIGKTEVSNAQYVEFLNAVAESDPYALYDMNMMLDTRGGIVRDGIPGSYAYAVKQNAIGQGPGGSDYTYADKPVVFVSWFDAIRFVNWLHNGQGNGDTETGAYTLLGGTFTPSNGNTVTRNPAARWWLPSEDEWYKAAYYDSNVGVYYDYPTGTNSLPNNNLPSADTGNSANFRVGPTYATGDDQYPMTDVGAYTLSASRYGTFDQAGNVTEWIDAFRFSSSRGVRGGSWDGSVLVLHAVPRDDSTGRPPAFQQYNIGFRVATIIPEPRTLTLAAFGLLVLLYRPRRLATP